MSVKAKYQSISIEKYILQMLNKEDVHINLT